MLRRGNDGQATECDMACATGNECFLLLSRWYARGAGHVFGMPEIDNFSSCESTILAHKMEFHFFKTRIGHFKNHTNRHKLLR